MAEKTKNIPKPMILSALGPDETLLMKHHRTLIPNFMRGAFPALTGRIKNVVLFYDCGDYSRDPARLHNRYTIIVSLSETLNPVFDNIPLRMPPDHWVLLFPFQRHGYRPMDNPQAHKRIHIQFDIDRFEDESFMILRNHVFAISPQEKDILLLILKQVLPANEQAHLSSVPHLTAAFIESRLSRIFSGAPLASAREQPGRVVGKVLRYIRDNFNRPLDIGTIADATGVSESHLRYLFRTDNEGMSLGKFIRWLKFYIAIELLGNSNLKIAEISGRCGFSSQFSFSRFFKQYTGGIPPLAYRRESRKENSERLRHVCR